MNYQTKRRSSARILLATTALSTMLVGGVAVAQTASAANDTLQEVVVTATRQNSTVNKAPISISAQTQQTLDAKGVKDLSDVSRTTPGVQFTRSPGGQSFDVNIRGVFSPVGAPTTGIYIDDTPIGRRGGANGSSFAAFSTPAPKLFDLDRVEVLRGPQGTLYGGSAMGGAVRFINPTPSLTKYSAYGRAEVNKLKGGSSGGEIGLAVGGPIIEDKLGFRASVWTQKTPGWIDHINMFHTGVDNVAVPGVATDEVVMDSNTNTGKARSGRLALLWQANEHLRVQPSLFMSYDRRDDSDQWMGKVGQYTVKGGTVTNNPSFPAYAPLAICPTALGTAISPATIAANCFPNQGSYSWQTYQDGPYNLGYGRTGNGIYTDTSSTGGRASYAKSVIKYTQPSLVLDYEFPTMLVHSSTSLIHDESKAFQEGKFGTAGQPIATQFLPQGITGTCGNSATSQNWQDLAGGCAPLYFKKGPNDAVGYPQLYQGRTVREKRNGVFQELRFASANPDSPLTWVGGVYFGYNKLRQFNAELQDVDRLGLYIKDGNNCAGFGSYACPFLAPTIYQSNGLGYTAYTNTTQKDTEVAAFGDMTYMVTEKLRLTAGVRISRITYEYATVTGGPHATGLPLGFTPTAAQPFAVNYAACPDVQKGCPFTNLNSSITQSPITPKFGASYQYNDTTLFYANAAKGYRPGGANSSVNPAICAADFASLGIANTPLNYRSDSIWSYEGGFKARLLGAVQLNMAGFLVDWKSPQATVTLSQCGRGYTSNAGHAQVKGVDGDMTWRVSSNFTVTGSASLVHGEYTERLAALGTNAAALPGFQKGEPMRNIPELSYTLGAQYIQPITEAISAYGRAELQHTGRYVRGARYGSSGWNPLTRYGAMRDNVLVRAGVKYNDVDVNLFVNNVFDDKTPLNIVYGNFVPGLFYSSPNPRTVGLQVTYRK